MNSSAEYSISKNKNAVEEDVESSGATVDAAQEATRTESLIGACFALFLSAIGVTVLVQSWGYGLGTDDNIIGPGTAPVVLGALIFIGGLVIAIKDFRTLKLLRANHRRKAESDPVSPTGSRLFINSILMPAGIVVIYLVGIYLSQFTGVLLTLSAVVFVCGLVIEKMPVWKALMMALAMMLLGYLLFDLMLAARFPESLVGF